MLHVHRGERADALVPPLAEVLSVPPADPFTPELVAVPTQGVERWLAQRLSHHLGAAAGTQAGVCANVSFASPARFVAGVLAGLLELDPDADPWQLDRLTWSVLAELDAAVGQPWAAVLERHLGAGDVQGHGRRLRLARHIAGLFTDYGGQRPDLITGWAAGDGSGERVPDDLAWQPLLWQRVRQRLGVPSPPERLARAVEVLTAGAGPVELPARLCVFGPTRLPQDQLRVLAALAAGRDVHLWLVHPSAALWQACAARPAGSSRRRDAVTVARHPLLASMARDVVELQLRIASVTSATTSGATFGVAVSRVDVRHPAPEPPGTLLGALQRRLRADVGDDDAGVGDRAAGRHRLGPADRSVEVHSCHGRARQVEVLREVLVGLFADDPSLEPRDVLVMCPDVEAIAPLVAATFGHPPERTDAPDGAHPGQLLRVRLADRSVRQTNPQLVLLGALLDLADGRVSASQVLDLAAGPAVRQRFELDDDDLDRLRQWTVATGARWGEDAGRRARFGLPELRQGTWDAALDRLLLGAAMAEEDYRYVGSALPLDDVDSTDLDLAGRFAELLDRLASVLARLDGRHPVAYWIDVLGDALDVLTAGTGDTAWQGVQARRVLADVRRSAAGQPDLPLRLADVRALLADRLAGRPTRAGFRTGALTVCSLEPMRSVPHRVVCLLGLDDGAFPRAAASNGDDLLLREPRIGERDRRSEDRQLFLDAIASAGDRLVVLYSGADERTGAARPPAVPVAELLDVLDRMTVVDDGRAARDHLVIRHPLQPVDERNFTASALGRPGPFSFDATARRAALAGREPRVGRTRFLARPLPALPRPDAVELLDLIAFLEHPAKWFLRTRLQVTLPGDTDDVTDRLPLELDPLARWQLGDRLLAARLAGADRARATNAEWRRGEVPPRELGRAALAQVGDRVVPIAAAVGAHLRGRPVVVDVTADLPSGTPVLGSVGDVHDGTVVRCVFSRLGAKHRLRAWIQLLALTTAHPEQQWLAVTVGRAPGGRPAAATSTLRAPAPALAAQRLDDLVRLREKALREPLPVPVATAHAYARSRHGGNAEEQALDDARAAWTASFEAADSHHALCWGEGAALADLLGTPDAAERAWFDDGTRFGVLARRIWEPLLQHEQVRTA
jgi:exodeoxyribonuclease V gamma subunit